MAGDVERLLYREARLLDSGLFSEWLELLAPDVRYWAPSRAELPREQERKDEPVRLCLFDETKESLTNRIRRLATGLAWAENPPTRTRRFVSNITADEDANGMVRVQSNFLVFRSRSFTEETILVGCREDKWCRAETWLLKERKILVDHCTVENISILI
jgi:3-phenylpropionate/cinnamic acid dioxygenase small subunit